MAEVLRRQPVSAPLRREPDAGFRNTSNALYQIVTGQGPYALDYLTRRYGGGGGGGGIPGATGGGSAPAGGTFSAGDISAFPGATGGAGATAGGGGGGLGAWWSGLSGSGKLNAIMQLVGTGAGLYGTLGGGSSGGGNLANYNIGNAGDIEDLGLAQLANILLRGGQSDPRYLNRQIAEAERGTQARQMATEGEFARRNLGGAGALPALQAAIGESGEERIASIRERDQQMAQDRLLPALGLVGSIVQQPQIQRAAVATGQYSAEAAARNADEQRRMQQQAAALQFLGTLLSAYGGG